MAARASEKRAAWPVHRGGGEVALRIALATQVGKDRQGAYLRLRPRYMEAVLAQAGGLAAPDANSTLRVTYGQVKSVEPRDGMVWKPFTTLGGVAARHTGSGEFNVPVIVDDTHHFMRHPNQVRVDASIAGYFEKRFLSPAAPTGGKE